MAGQRRPAELPREYLAFFDCFNRQEFFRAHEELEPLWLNVRQTPQADFFQGLIQLAAAFVHVEKGRTEPALALFRSAREKIETYPSPCLALEVPDVLHLIEHWMAQLKDGGTPTLPFGEPPHLSLAGR